jgi:hypothetical protein
MRHSLTQIFQLHNTDKHPYHHYGDIYTSLLNPIRDISTSILEIGIQNGASLRVWRDFFPYANVHGIDIQEQAAISELRIESHIFNQSDARRLFDLGWRKGPFDFICDDGSHQFSDQVTSLLNLYPFLHPSHGIYVIEDVQSNEAADCLLDMGAKIYRTGDGYDDVLAVFERDHMNYGFKCPEESCTSKAFFNFLTPMNARPKCPKHQVHYIPDIAHSSAMGAQEPETIDITITPEHAKELLSTAFESSFEGVDPLVVTSYANLMSKGQWKDVNIEMGGAHYPIYMRDDRVLLGIQRLMACIEADTSFSTVMVKTYGYY